MGDAGPGRLHATAAARVHHPLQLTQLRPSTHQGIREAKRQGKLDHPTQVYGDETGYGSRVPASISALRGGSLGESGEV